MSLKKSIGNCRNFAAKPGVHGMKKFLLLTFLCIAFACSKQKAPIVFQTDFGLKDGAVSAMKGVAYTVDDELALYDLSHEIPAYNVWEAAYRLYQTAPYWPAGTVFVSVVDPGVGTERRSVVAKTKTGHYFVTPDNGTLTLIADAMGIEAVRTIDESKNRRQGSGDSYTFHGRDVYAYTAARLASGKIVFEEVGPVLTDSLIRLPYQKPQRSGGLISGTIPVLDVQYGNVWTNIHDSLFKQLHVKHGDWVSVEIRHKDSLICRNTVSFARTFGDVPEGRALAYLNSLMNFSLAVNTGNFADSFNVSSGNQWTIQIQKAKTSSE